VHDQVDRIGRRVIQQRQARFDFFQPRLEAAAFPLVEGREAADDPLRQQASTSCGLEIRNIGAATTGKRRFCSSEAGSDIGSTPSNRD